MKQIDGKLWLQWYFWIHIFIIIITVKKYFVFFFAVFLIYCMMNRTWSWWWYTDVRERIILFITTGILICILLIKIQQGKFSALKSCCKTYLNFKSKLFEEHCCNIVLFCRCTYYYYYFCIYEKWCKYLNFENICFVK